MKPPIAGPPADRLERAGIFLLFAALLTGCALSLHAAWHWPLVGDSSLIRYAVLLIHSGRAPYSQIHDINLPGSYLLESAAMHTFGWNAHGLRLYDGFLCLLLCLFSYLIGHTRKARLFGLAAGLLFVLIHLHDGLFQAGQRDLALAVILLASLALIARNPSLTPLTLFSFEFLIGFSLTLKPTLLPLALLPLLRRSASPQRSARSALRCLLVGAAGLATPLLVTMLWLWRAGALRAFVTTLSSIDALHSQLGRKPLSFLLAHCTSPVLVLFLLWGGFLLARLLDPRQPAVTPPAATSPSDPQRRLLLFATLCGLLSYLEQGKGLTYQRYPFLAAALLLLFTDFAHASRLRPLPYTLSAIALACTALWFAPRFTADIRSFDTAAPFQTALAQQLQSLKLQSLHTHTPATVQCLDTYVGCINTLYDTRTLQATGFLYDCYLFTAPSKTRDAYRAAFLQAFDQARPSILILTGQSCFRSARTFDRILTWPALADRLTHDYNLHAEWQSNESYKWWSKRELPIGYRVYVHK